MHVLAGMRARKEPAVDEHAVHPTPELHGEGHPQIIRRLGILPLLQQYQHLLHGKRKRHLHNEGRI